MILQMLSARNGDAIAIYNEHEKRKCNIIIDGGPASAYEKELRKVFEKMNTEGIEAIILTHADDDHIGGLIRFLERTDNHNIKYIYFNSPEGLEQKFKRLVDAKINVTEQDKNHNFSQAKSLEEFIKEKGIAIQNTLSTDDNKINAGEVIFEILSPTKVELNTLSLDWKEEAINNQDHGARTSDYECSIEDLWERKEDSSSTVMNDSSIALLMTCNGKNILLLGDANPLVVQKVLEDKGYSEQNKLNVDYVKLSHHGSKNNTTLGLFNIINSNKFLISTNGARYKHPDKEALARIVKIVSQRGEKTHFYFNYEFDRIFTQGEIEKYNINCERKCEFSI